MRRQSLGYARKGFLIPALVLFSIGAFAVGYLYYRDYEGKVHVEMEDQLAAVADLKVGELLQFRKERRGNADVISDNPAFAALARRCLRDPGDEEASSELGAWLDSYTVNYQFDRAILVDAGGVARISKPSATSAPLPAALSQAAAEAASTGRAFFQDFFLDEGDGRPYLAVVAPIAGGAAGGHAGAVVLRIDPSTYLYPFIKHWPTPSASAETLLIRRDGDSALFLNDLRFHADAALDMRTPLTNTRMPAVKAALGEEGIVEGEDYRGVTVIASIGAVPGSPWFIVAKVDMAEALAPLRERLGILLSLVSLLVLGASASLALFLRGQRLRFYRDKYQTMQALQETTAFLESLIKYANAPIIVWDSGFRITRFNHAFESLTGLRASQVLGGALDPLFPSEQAERSLRLIRDTGSGTRWETVEIDVRGADGEARTVLWNSAPIYAADGSTLVATIAQGQDISAIKDAEARMSAQIEELMRWQNVLLGRESRILELKWEVNELLAQTGREARYGGYENE